MVIAFALSSVVAYYHIGRINDASISSHQSLVAAARSARLLTLILEQTNALRGYVIKGDEEFAKTYQQTKLLLDDELSSFAASTNVALQKDAAERMRAGIVKWRATIGDKVIDLMRDPANRALAADLTGTKSLGQLRAIQKEMTETAQAQVAARDAEQQDATREARMALIAGSIVALSLGGAMAIVLARAVASPLLGMSAAMARLAAGDQTIVVPATGRRDEIGALAGALVRFKEAAIEKSRMEMEAQEQRRMSEADRASSEARRAHSAAAQAKVVTALAAGLGRLSDGDLTFRLEEAFSPDYERLRADFNKALGTLQDTIGIISGTSNEIRLGACELSEASGDLSHRTEAQAASLEETAAALDEITATVKRTAEGAKHASDIVGSAKVDAEQSRDVVRQAVDAMSRIQDSSQQIGQIVGVIDEIAFQTNLLALNAGVEAARAGEAGLGFAVVAAEVRELAQRSAGAAKDIKALIAASVGQVNSGVTLVKQTGGALQRMATQVVEITAIVSEIAASAREQATGLDQVNAAVNQMDQVTQQNAAMVQQATAASGNLLAQADELGQLVDQFKIKPLASVGRRAA